MSRSPSLRVIGRSEILLPPVQDAIRRDLAFDIVFELIDTNAGLQRVVTRPDSFDVYHQWHTVDLVWTARAIQPINLRRIQGGEAIKHRALTCHLGVPSTGAVFDQVFLHAGGQLRSQPSDEVLMLPTIQGVDAFGYLPQVPALLGDGAVDSWGWMLDARLHGRVSIMADPVLGMIEAAMAVECAEGLRFTEIGNLSVEEIDLVADLLLHKKKIGHFRSTWGNSQDAARQMQKGGVVLQSMFSPAFTQLRSEGVSVVYAAPREGCRGWHCDLCLSAATQGEVLDAAYAYCNWWMSGQGGAILARQGYYSVLPERVRPYLSDAEWDYWYEGRPAETTLSDPYGRSCIAPGQHREGGSYLARMAQVRVWNTFMDEHTYLVRRWREFLEA